jgi:hypothetical protein
MNDVFSIYAVCRKNNSISLARLTSRLMFTEAILVALGSTALHLKYIGGLGVDLQALGVSNTTFVMFFVPLCFSLSYLFIPSNIKLEEEFISGRVPKSGMLQILFILWLFTCISVLGPTFLFKAL